MLAAVLPRAAPLQIPVRGVQRAPGVFAYLGQASADLNQASADLGQRLATAVGQP